MFKEVIAQGTPREIGLTHGREAREQIHGSIAFYTGMFQRTANKDWASVRQIAQDRFKPVIRQKWPEYLEEIEGIAEGAGLEPSDIIALNTRTEIAFGMFSDGCTSLAWKSSDNNFNYLAQNWDWMPAQKKNLIRLTIIQQAPKPTIRVVTEGGLIGKIGLNSAGVGVCFNAIRAQGVDHTRLPAHLALRTALDSTSRAEALRRIDEHGVAASCHILIADRAEGGLGLEYSSIDGKQLVQDEAGRVPHANHYVLDHPGVIDTRWLPDSADRDARIKELASELDATRQGKPLGVDDFKALFRDKKGAPKSISRASMNDIDSATLFNIVMDLKNIKAYVSVGPPSEPPEAEYVFEF